MRDGFVKVAAGTPKIRVVDCDYNAGQIIALMKDAAAKGVKVLALPELCVTGYTCGDLFLQDTLLDGAERALGRILEETKELNLFAAVGLPIRYRNKLYIQFVSVSDGQAHSGKQVQLLRLLQNPPQGPLGPVQQGILQKQVPAGIPGDAQLRQGQNLHTLCRRVLHQRDDLPRVVIAVHHPDFRRSRRNFYKAVPHEFGLLSQKYFQHCPKFAPISVVVRKSSKLHLCFVSELKALFRFLFLSRKRNEGTAVFYPKSSKKATGTAYKLQPTFCGIYILFIDFWRKMV